MICFNLSTVRMPAMLIKANENLRENHIIIFHLRGKPVTHAELDINTF